MAVLTGAGGTFCAGADLQAVASGDRQPGHRGRSGTDGADPPALSKPVIAAVEGHAVAGGLELAVWCDLRVAAEDAVFGVFCRRFGVPLVDGGTVRLPRIVGEGRALDLILSGRAVGAAEALAMGLVNRVVPTGTALESAVAWATELAALPQVCLRNDRRSALAQWNSPGGRGAAPSRPGSGWTAWRRARPLDGATRFAGGAGRGGTTVAGPGA